MKNYFCKKCNHTHSVNKKDIVYEIIDTFYPFCFKCGEIMELEKDKDV